MKEVKKKYIIIQNGLLFRSTWYKRPDCFGMQELVFQPPICSTIVWLKKKSHSRHHTSLCQLLYWLVYDKIFSYSLPRCRLVEIENVFNDMIVIFFPTRLVCSYTECSTLWNPLKVINHHHQVKLFTTTRTSSDFAWCLKNNTISTSKSLVLACRIS